MLSLCLIAAFFRPVGFLRVNLSVVFKSQGLHHVSDRAMQIDVCLICFDAWPGK